MDQVRRKRGVARDALVRHTRQLVIENGAENFTLADVCRLAEVTTAAPYNHFRDKQDILEEIVARAFYELAAQTKVAASAHGEGTPEGIVAMGQAYVRFAVEEPRIFRLMFGHEHVVAYGSDCFQNVVQQVALFCERNGIAGNPQLIALELWTFVHGAASLSIDEDYKKVAPGIDIDALIANVTWRLLGVR